jgi:hypothetical protein
MEIRRALAEATGWSHPCPECGTTMTGTGTVIHQSNPARWYVELWCSKDAEAFTIWTPDLQAHVVARLGEP